MKTLLKKITIIVFIVCISPTIKSQNNDCLTFDGNDDYLIAENLALNQIGTNNFTFEAWIKGEESIQIEHPTIFSNRPSEVSGAVFFLHGVWGNSISKMLAVQLEGVNYFVFNNGTLNASMLDNQCHHVAITRNSNLLTFYFDGNPIGTRVITNGNPTVGSTNQLYIGQDPAIMHAFAGTLSQIRIWDYARSQSDIQGNMNISIIPPINGLLGYWEMNEGSGEIIFDKTSTADAQRGSTNTTDVNDPNWSSNCCLNILGIPDENIPKFSIFPNPARNFTNISVQEEATYSLINLDGQLLQRGKLIRGDNALDVSTYPNGLYFVHIKTATANNTLKMIKQ